MSAGIVVLGAGHGGVQAAASLRGDGYEGPVTLVSGEPDLPYQKPPLSKIFLEDDTGSEPPALRPAPFYDKNDIRLELGVEVTAIDRAGHRLELAGGRYLGYDKLVLATGSRVRRPDLPGNDAESVVFLRTARDAGNLRERLRAAGRVAVIGGGFIGLEVAATAASLGKSVVVLEAADRLLGRAVSTTVSGHFLKLHAGLGNEVRLGQNAARIEAGGGGVEAVVTSEGHTVECDLVLIAIGILPNTELAGAAGLACDNGIVVNGSMMTADPDIAAVGDCASHRNWQTGAFVRLESVQNAVDQARCASRALTGAPADYDRVAWFWSDQGAAKLQIAGLAAGADGTVVRGDPDAAAFSVFLYRGGRLACVESVNRTADHLAARKLLAAGLSPTMAQAADPGFDLKQLLDQD